MFPTNFYAATALPNQLYNPSYPEHLYHNAFPEGFVFECPYHPGGSISVTTHRDWLSPLRATVHCNHSGCHFSAYDNGMVSSPSQCPTARAERARDGPGDLKPGTRIPFHSLIYRRKWIPNQADSTGRVVIPADIDPVMERCPGCPVPPIKAPNVNAPQTAAKTPVVSSQHKATDTNESSLPSNTEDRGSSCFGNNIKGGCTKSDKKVEKKNEGTFEGFRGNRLWNTPSDGIAACFDQFAAENPGLKQNFIHPVLPPPRDDPPPQSDIHIVDAGEMKLSGDDDYVDVPRSPEKANLPRRRQTLRNVYYRDAVYNDDHGMRPTSTCSSTSSEPAQNRLTPEAYPGTAQKATVRIFFVIRLITGLKTRGSQQLGGTKNQRSKDDTINRDTFHLNSDDRGGKQDTLPGFNEAAAEDSTDDSCAKSIANLVLRLAEIPGRLNSLEKINEATVKDLNAKNAKIEDLEAAIERAKRREQELEDIINIYETC
ncbi:hypothetical protein BJ165DRAFT_971369 [Panaeolus papilionaceus]|nr:hypothetical protein BJ165DRAFT_971369 [Panaeolus papilionaceus]